MSSPVYIGTQPVGYGYPTYIIAEISANHGQDINLALELIDAAVETGANAVKLQTYTPNTMTLDVDSPIFSLTGTLWEGQNLYDLYQSAYMPWEWYPELWAHAQKRGITIFSTPFDATAVDFLEAFNPPAYKIASFECNDLPLIRKVASTGKPTILSTGAAPLSEIIEAVECFYKAGGKELILLKCTSAYPAPLEDANLKTIPHLHHTFMLPVGLSDHTLGHTLPVLSVALGACVIEKHLTLSHNNATADEAFSMDPNEFGTMVKQVRLAEQALGTIKYGPTPSEQNTQRFKRSLFSSRDIQAGEILDSTNVQCIRPSDGLHSRYLEDILGKQARSAIPKGTPLNWFLIN